MAEVSLSKNSYFLPLSLFLITAATRIPFTSKFLYHMDSVQFALAMEKYDITVHQPHPPGYFLYVMLGKILDHFVRDANTTLVSISVIFSALTVVSIFYLGKELFDVKTGFIAAAFAITSPNLWFHGEVALTYVVEAFFSTAMAFLCWKIYRGEHKYLWLSVIVLGVAGGVRQNTAVFLLPLWLFSARGVPAGKVLPSLFLLGLVCLLWFVPMIWMTGGWSAYRNALRELWVFNTGYNTVFEKGWPRVKLFSSTLYDFTLYGTGAGMFALIAGPVLAFYSRIRLRRALVIDKEKVAFFFFWVLPPVLFYILIFIYPSNPGYALIFLPALFVLMASSIGYVSRELKTIPPKGFLFPAAIALIISNVFIFFSNRPVSYREIEDHDRNLAAMIRSIQKFDPTKTAIFVEPYVLYGYRQIMYYLPEYRVYQIDMRKAPTGERRRTFWGVNGQTFTSDGITLPEGFGDFIIPMFSDGRDKVKGIAGIEFVAVGDMDMYMASGPIRLLKQIYPELKASMRSAG